MKKKISIILLLLILLLNINVYADIGIEDHLRSYILADSATGKILESYNIHEVVEIASISKIMTYAVVMDHVIKGDLALDDELIIDADTERIKGSTFDLKEGERFTVQELLEASLVVSGNDATYALAKHVAGSEAGFAKLMNGKAREIGLENAIFYNSTGLPIYPEDVQNQMTTEELFELANYIINNYPEVIEITKLRAIGMAERDFFHWNSNPLIPKIKEVDGLKTGFTNKAGYCHIATFIKEAEKGEEDDLRLISIVMGADDLKQRNKTSETLVRYGLDNYSNKVFLDSDLPVSKLYFENGKVQEINIYPSSSYSELVKEDEDIEIEVELKDKASLPLKRDQVVGSVRVVEAGKTVYESDVLVKESLKKANLLTRIGRKVKALFT